MNIACLQSLLMERIITMLVDITKEIHNNVVFAAKF